jgi:hypothetical protein
MLVKALLHVYGVRYSALITIKSGVLARAKMTEKRQIKRFSYLQDL